MDSDEISMDVDGCCSMVMMIMKNWMPQPPGNHLSLYTAQLNPSPVSIRQSTPIPHPMTTRLQQPQGVPHHPRAAISLDSPRTHWAAPVPPPPSLRCGISHKHKKQGTSGESNSTVALHVSKTKRERQRKCLRQNSLMHDRIASIESETFIRPIRPPSAGVNPRFPAQLRPGSNEHRSRGRGSRAFTLGSRAPLTLAGFGLAITGEDDIRVRNIVRFGQSRNAVIGMGSVNTGQLDLFFHDDLFFQSARLMSWSRRQFLRCLSLRMTQRQHPVASSGNIFSSS